MSKQFPIEVVMTVAHQKLLCSIDEVHRIMNFLTADKLKQIAPLELERRATNAAYKTWNDLVSLVNFIGAPNTKQKAIAAMKMRFLEQFSDDSVNKQAR